MCNKENSSLIRYQYFIEATDIKFMMTVWVSFGLFTHDIVLFLIGTHSFHKYYKYTRFSKSSASITASNPKSLFTNETEGLVLYGRKNPIGMFHFTLTFLTHFLFKIKVTVKPQ